MIAAAAKRSNEVVTGFTTGSPLAVVIVWALNAYLLPAPMQPEIAVAVGAVVTSAVAGVARLFNRRK